jgi:hypothetical protein
MIWREKRVTLIVLGVLFAAAAGFFLTYRVQYEARLQDLDANLHQEEQRLSEARNVRLAAERQYAAYMRTEHDLNVLYNERFATQEQRLIALINEVKRLAVASELVPKTYSFSRSETKKAGEISAVGANTVLITFTVQGTYAQLRRLINLLELSGQFIIIDSVGLSSASNDSTLNINLRLKTLFRETPPVTPPFASKEM